MTRAFVILLVLLLAPDAGRAEVGEADRGAIRQVIESQLAAFQRDDGPAAFAHASPMIRQKFGDAGTFMEMVRTGYAPVYRPQKFEFRELIMQGGTPVQQVYLVGPDGEPVMALYEMQRQPDASWKINGCILTKLPGASV